MTEGITVILLIKNNGSLEFEPEGVSFLALILISAPSPILSLILKSNQMFLERNYEIKRVWF